jgi:hypothetical protein
MDEQVDTEEVVEHPEIRPVEPPAESPVGATWQLVPAPSEPAPTVQLGEGIVATSSFAKLAAALCRAQSKFEPLQATRTANAGSYSYTYANLADTLAAALPALTAEGLALIQAPSVSDGRTVTVTTVLVHTSGEYLKQRLSMIAEAATPTKIGIAITYARRYSLLALFGLSPEDADTEPEQGRPKQQQRTARSAPPPPEPDDELAAELDAIMVAIGAATSPAELARVAKRIQRLPEDARSQFAEPYKARQQALRAGAKS